MFYYGPYFVRAINNLLKQKGYEVIVFDLINPAASFCYNPFVYVHDDREVLTLIENLIQNTTPSHSKSRRPLLGEIRNRPAASPYVVPAARGSARRTKLLYGDGDDSRRRSP